MSPEELAARHPCLYHVTDPEAWDLISRLGLLSTFALLEMFEVDAKRRQELVTQRRPDEVEIRHDDYGVARLNDNRPLSEAKLSKCLDDGLKASDWLQMLNKRVFFWPSRKSLSTLLGAERNQNRKRQILIFDTLALVTANLESVELSPINSGSTIHRPARRGLSTFTPIGAKSYREWRVQRGKRDFIKEVVVRNGVQDIGRFLIGKETAG